MLIKNAKRILSVLLILVIICGCGFTAFAVSNNYQSNSKFHDITKSQAEAKYINGDKFILYYYRDTCYNSQNVGTNVLEAWMNKDGTDIYGVSTDEYLPSFLSSKIETKENGSYTLPVTAFVENGTVVCYNMTTYSYSEYVNLIKTKYSSFMNITNTNPDDSDINVTPTGENVYSFNVTYHQSDARSMLSSINNLRKDSNAWYWNESNTQKVWKTGLSALEYDYDLEKIAMQRAAELVAYYSHTRPNGERCFTLYDVYYSAGENIAMGFTTAASVETAWEEETEPYSGQGHRRNMLNGNITAVGLACAEYNGTKFWVQEFRSPTVNKNYVAPNDSLTKVSVEISKSIISSKSLVLSQSSITLTKGNNTKLPQTYIKIVSIGRNTVYIPINSAVWTSGNSSIASISGNNVYGIQSGSTNLNVTADGCSSSIPITVQTATTPVVPDNPDTPDVPDIPDTPDNPDTPDIPDTPETSENDENSGTTTFSLFSAIISIFIGTLNIIANLFNLIAIFL